MKDKILKIVVINLLLITIGYSAEIQPISDFSKYPISKSLTSQSRGGDLPDKISATDGVGSLLLKPINKDNSKLDNSAYNKLLRENLSKLDNNNSLNDLITSGDISISQDVLDKINNNIVDDNSTDENTSDENTTETTSNTVDCYGADIGSTVDGQLVVDRDTLDDMISNGDDITNVCTSNITDMSYLFYDIAFNQDISNWDVSHVTTMYCMFYKTTEFNQPIGNWDVSNVTNIHSMFNSTTAFNQPLNNWNTSSITEMYGVFYNTGAFNQDISSWDTSNVTTMSYMFGSAAKFNQPLNNWDTSKVEDMSAMFYYNKAFNQDISSWDISSVTNMNYMFYYSDVFNQNISNWNVDNVDNYTKFYTGSVLDTANVPPKFQ